MVYNFYSNADITNRAYSSNSNTSCNKYDVWTGINKKPNFFIPKPENEVVHFILLFGTVIFGKGTLYIKQP